MADIAWLIPGLIAGSGGHRTILQHADALNKAGHRCFIYIGGVGKQAEATAAIEKLFGYHFEHAYFGWDAIRPVDLAFATIWHSAGVVSALPFPCKKGYFVQDYEALFSAMGDSYLLAENSYRYGLTPVTIGRWLKHVLETRFDTPAYHIDFGADTNIYKPLPAVKKEKAICFIHQPDKPRRCAHIGLAALAIVKHHMPDVTIYLYGSPPPLPGLIPFAYEHLGLLGLHDCNALYNRCAVGLCLSASNPSRIPFEMMAAGLPVVEFWRDNNLYDFNNDIVSLSLPTPESLASNLMQLLNDPVQRKSMSDASRQFMQSRALAEESAQFIRATHHILAGQAPAPAASTPTYTRAAITAPMTATRDDVASLIAMAYSRRLAFLPTPVRTVLSKGLRFVRHVVNA